MKTPKRTDIIAECYERSLTLLRKNCDRNGVIAAARSNKAADRGYAAVFGRDAAIYSLGMLASEDRELIRKAKASLLTLAKHQARNGQIPKYVKPESREVDFCYSDCIDATLWWLIAVDFYDRTLPVLNSWRHQQSFVKYHGQFSVNILLGYILNFYRILFGKEQ